MRNSAAANLIVHPTDFSPEADRAFAHALRLAIHNHGHLTLLHAAQHDEEVSWEQFPSVRETLTRWGLLKEGAARSEVAKLGIQIEKGIGQAHLVSALEQILTRRAIEMLVLATEGRVGFSRLLAPSLAEKAARTLKVPTMFVPARGRDCVSLADGTVTMDQVLVPVCSDLPVAGAIERALRAAHAFGHARTKLTLLHVGDEADFDRLPAIESPYPLERMVRKGDVVEAILRAAEETTANLVVMLTEGVHGLSEQISGTRTEQVVREAPCPVLSVPAEF